MIDAIKQVDYSINFSSKEDFVTLMSHPDVKITKAEGKFILKCNISYEFYIPLTFDMTVLQAIFIPHFFFFFFYVCSYICIHMYLYLSSSLAFNPILGIIVQINKFYSILFIFGLHCRLCVSGFSFIHNVTLGLKVQRNKVTTASIGVVKPQVKAVTSCSYISLPSADGFPKCVVSIIVWLTPAD